MRALTPGLLVQHYGRRSQIARQAIPALFKALGSGAAAYRDWYGRSYTVTLPDRYLIPLGHQYRIRLRQDPQRLVFVVQTYYALLVKLLAARALGIDTGPDLLHWLRGIEDGSAFRERGIQNLTEAGEYDWYLESWDASLAEMVTRMVAPLATCALDGPAPDLLKALYHDLFPRRLRHILGEYYTPDWLAAHLLDTLRYTGRTRLLDPTCGSGTFLALAALRALRHNSVTEVFNLIAGVDINPLAALAARANLLLALGPELRRLRIPVTLPVKCADVVLHPPGLGTFDVIAGNPPWINWEHLPDAVRQQTRTLWQMYGLFTHSGMETILGKGKKDLAMLLTYLMADRYLRDQGCLGFIITQSALKSGGAGDGFRRFWIRDETPLKVLHVDDMSAVEPFAGAATRTAVLVLQKGQRTQYPVPYVLWRHAVRRHRLRETDSLEEVTRKTERVLLLAEPVDPQRPGSPWLSGRPAALRAVRRLAGESDYTAHAGVYTGGANGVFWLEVQAEHADGTVTVRNLTENGKRSLQSLVFTVESDLVYPLLRGRDVSRWSAVPGAAILMVQDPHTRRGYDEAWLHERYPLAYEYLSRFEPVLRRRAAYRRYFKNSAPFYSMFNVGTYSFAPVKVVWQGFGVRQMRAAVIDMRHAERTVMSNQAMHPFIGLTDADEGHYLAACLNAAPFEYAVISHTQSGGKSFAQPGILKILRLLRYDPADGRHRQLAQLSRRAHAGEDREAVEGEIDRLAADLWGISLPELRDIQQSMRDLQR